MGLWCRGACKRNSSFKWLVVWVQREELLLIRNGWIPLDTRGATTGDNWNVLSFHINCQWTLFVMESIMVIRCNKMLRLGHWRRISWCHLWFWIAVFRWRWRRQSLDGCEGKKTTAELIYICIYIHESATESCPTKMTWGDVNLITFLEIFRTSPDPIQHFFNECHCA